MKDSFVLAGCNRVSENKLLYEARTADATCDSPCKLQIAFIRWYLLTLTFDLELGSLAGMWTTKSAIRNERCKRRYPFNRRQTIREQDTHTSIVITLKLRVKCRYQVLIIENKSNSVKYCLRI